MVDIAVEHPFEVSRLSATGGAKEKEEEEERGFSATTVLPIPSLLTRNTGS